LERCGCCQSRQYDHIGKEDAFGERSLVYFPLQKRESPAGYTHQGVGCGRFAIDRHNSLVKHSPVIPRSEYRVPRSFMYVPERFLSHSPTPAVWPKGGTLYSAGGPCLSPS